MQKHLILDPKKVYKFFTENLLLFSSKVGPLLGDFRKSPKNGQNDRFIAPPRKTGKKGKKGPKKAKKRVPPVCHLYV